MFALEPFFLCEAPFSRIRGSPHGDGSPGDELVNLAQGKAGDRREVFSGKPTLTAYPKFVQRLVVDEAEGFQEDRRQVVDGDDAHGFRGGIFIAGLHLLCRRGGMRGVVDHCLSAGAIPHAASDL